MKERVLKAYFDEQKEAEEIAGELGTTIEEIEAVLGDPKALEPYRQRAEAAKIRAQICVNESAEEAARIQTRMLRREEESSAVVQRAAKDILDRAGVGVEKEDKGEVKVRFVHGMPRLGMPKRIDDDDERA